MIYLPRSGAPRKTRTTQALLCSVSLGILLAGANGAWAQSAPVLYVTNETDNSVSVISTSSNTVTSTVTGLSTPWGAAVRGDGSLAYVVSLNGGSIPGWVSVIDASTNAIIGAPITVQAGPTAITLTPDGRQAYITNENSNSVSVIDTATNMVTRTVAVGINPFAVTVASNGAFAYVANNAYTSPADASISVINTATNNVVATIALGSNDRGDRDEMEDRLVDRDDVRGRVLERHAELRRQGRGALRLVTLPQRFLVGLAE